MLMKHANSRVTLVFCPENYVYVTRESCLFFVNVHVLIPNALLTFSHACQGTFNSDFDSSNSFFSNWLNLLATTIFSTRKTKRYHCNSRAQTVKCKSILHAVYSTIQLVRKISHPSQFGIHCGSRPLKRENHACVKC